MPIPLWCWLLGVCYIVIWLVNPGCTAGNIGRQLACYPISRTVRDLTSQWPFIRLLVSPTSLCLVMNSLSCGSVNICLTLASKVSSTNLIDPKASNTTSMRILWEVGLKPMPRTLITCSCALAMWSCMLTAPYTGLVACRLRSLSVLSRLSMLLSHNLFVMWSL